MQDEPKGNDDSPREDAAASEQGALELSAKLEAEHRRADENWEKFLRAQAEQDNIRKRAEREVENAHRYALERFAQDLLGAVDSLELGLKAAADAQVPEFQLEGITLTLRMLRESFAKHGIEVVDPLGQSFDPALHEAMSMVPSADADPNTVIEVMQKGYRLQDRLLRPAMVIVASASPPAS